MFSHNRDEGFSFSDNVHMLRRDEVDETNGRNPEQQALWMLQKQIIKDEFPVLIQSMFVPSYVACGNNAEEIRIKLKFFEDQQIVLNQAIAARSTNYKKVQDLRKARKPVPKKLLEAS